ncbi:F0F1 ATP synthase subunit B [Prosthecomicrobium pneumaticum]|uniref:ATP synthase subunit b n=1 Tax=Prosthecomicrobium pneumaticum TaxID=81895 RepID=A0A7W9FKZ6_9HYPH|nr:F0F1 ATP synthase subunit B [Prosthecomicrobium pneumaticum]MBB5751978.1 F-type H+-transporting ATPase subunit b [Prosthecomicrobium pneumaticum]
MSFFVTEALAQESAPAPAAPAPDTTAPQTAPIEPPLDAGAPADAHGAAEATHSEVGHEAAGHGGPFPPFDPSTFASQLVWLAISFALLYLLMKRVLAPRVGSIIEERAGRIADDIGRAERLREQSDAAIASYEKALAEARSQSQRIAAEATEAAKAEVAAERARIEAQLGAQLAAAEVRIGEIKSRALAEVGSIAEETAAEIVATLSGSAPQRDEVAGAVSAALGK